VGQIPLFTGATKASITATAPPIIGIALVAGFLAAAAALLWAAANAAEARSRSDRSGRLRALDELAATGLRPEQYAELRATLLSEPRR
jgi:hypothetical protein